MFTFRNRYISGYFMAPNTGGGGGGGDVDDEIEAPVEEESSPEEEEAPPEEEEPPAEEPDPIAKLTERFDTELKRRDEELAALRLQVEQGGKKDEPKPADPGQPPAKRDYYVEAVDFAKKNYPTSKLFDEDGDLTPEGVAWCNNHALDIAADARAEERDKRTAETRLTAEQEQMKADAPRLIESFAGALVGDWGEHMPEEDAKVVAKHFVEACTEIGLTTSQMETEQGAALARGAALMAYGRLYEQQLLAKKGGAAAPDEEPKDAKKNKAPINGGGPTNGNLAAKVRANPANKTFLEDFKASYGRDPNAAELNEMVKNKEVLV